MPRQIMYLRIIFNKEHSVGTGRDLSLHEKFILIPGIWIIDYII